jgi:Flp pilus assembly protein TadD
MNTFRPVASALVVLFSVMWLAAAPASAMMGDPSLGEPAWMTQARELLRDKRYEQAAQALQAANAADVAEWNNLLGYALRKKSPPDLAAAETHYKRALEIDPKHRHAMEYYGELFLMKGDLAGAEAMLKRLDKACFFGCEEYDDLKKAIERYKAGR